MDHVFLGWAVTKPPQGERMPKVDSTQRESAKPGYPQRNEDLDMPEEAVGTQQMQGREAGGGFTSPSGSSEHIPMGNAPQSLQAPMGSQGGGFSTVISIQHPAGGTGRGGHERPAGSEKRWSEITREVTWAGGCLMEEMGVLS